MRATNVNVSGSPVLLARGSEASTSAPNEVHVKVASGTDLVLGDVEGQSYPILTSDPEFVCFLYGDLELWVTGTGTLHVLQSG